MPFLPSASSLIRDDVPPTTRERPAGGGKERDGGVGRQEHRAVERKGRRVEGEGDVNGEMGKEKTEEDECDGRGREERKIG